MNQIGRRFALSNKSGAGVSCSESGLFVGAVPLLEFGSTSGAGGRHQWQPRPVPDLNGELSKRYGLPIEFGRKIDGLTAVARALSRGDVIHAQIAALHLQIPDPPTLAKAQQTFSETIDLAHQLRASALLKADWDPAKHPRWPAGSPGGTGGEFAPAGTASGDFSNDGPSTSGDVGNGPTAPVIPAQITIPVPFDIPEGIPFPSEIVPPPAIPDIYPRELRNPYPDRAGCDQEWAEAIKFCKNLLGRNQLGRGDYRGSGKSLYQCIMGQVSQRCGGNSTGA